MVSGIVHVLMVFVVLIDQEQLSLQIMGDPTETLTSIGHLIILLIFPKIGWKVSTCVGTTPVKSFLNQTTHSKVILKNPNAPYLSIIG